MIFEDWGFRVDSIMDLLEKEYAYHGFSNRLRIIIATLLKHCIENYNEEWNYRL